MKLKKKLLPPCLMEKIILKSKEIRWRINIPVSILEYRDVLCWKNIDIKSSKLDHRAFQLMNKVEYPLTSISIYVDDICRDDMRNLGKLGSSIECLNLKYHLRWVNILILTLSIRLSIRRIVFRSTRQFLDAPFPRLQKLHLTNARFACQDESPISLDLTRFSDTLEEFSLTNDTLDEFSIKSLANLKNLKVLTLQYAHSTCKNNFFLEALESMQELR